jgi:hypothetical protein
MGEKETVAQMFEREMKKEKTLDQIRAKRGGGGGLKKKEWPNYRDYDDDVLRKLEDGTRAEGFDAGVDTRRVGAEIITTTHELHGLIWCIACGDVGRERGGAGDADFSERLKTIPAGLEEKKAEEEKKEDADEAE